MFEDLNKKPKKVNEMAEIRQKFQQYLGKLTTIETKDIALKEIQQLILTNQEQKHLRIYISVLQEHKRPLNYTSNEQEVLILGYICSIYKENLLDPIDSPPSLQKSAYRIIEMVQKYFKDQNQNVQDACGKTWKELFKNVLLNEPQNTQKLILYDTLASLINSGADRISQESSTFVLQEFLNLLIKFQEFSLLQAISDHFLPSIYFKTQLDHPSMPRCVQHILKGIHIKHLLTQCQQITDKTLYFLTTKKKPDVPYKTKVECCELLELMAIQFQDVQDTVIGSFHDQIIPVLKEIQRDRVLKVQNAAKIAMKQWKIFENRYQQLEQFKQQKMPYDQNLNIDEIIKQKTKSDPNLVIQQFQQQDQAQELQYIENETDMRNMMAEQGGWVKETRGRNFQKKNSGTGGGQTRHVQKQQNRSKSSGFRSQSIKELIMKNNINTNQNKLDNVEFVYEKGQNNINQNLQENNNAVMQQQFQNLGLDQNQNNNNHQIYKPIQNIDIIPGVPNNPLININNTNLQDHNLKNSYHNQIETQILQQNQNQIQQLQQQQNNLIQQQNQLQQYYNEQQNQQYDQEQKEDQLEDTLVDFNSRLFQQQNINNNQNQQVQQAQQQQNSLWSKTIQNIQKENYNQAFIDILNSEDDLYLIRLLLLTGNNLSKLNKDIHKKVLQKYMQIQKSQFIQKLSLDFYQQALNNNVFKQNNQQTQIQQQNTVKNLYMMSAEQNSVGKRAAEIYNQFQAIQSKNNTFQQQQ